MTRYYYALADKFTGLYPRDYTSGFCDTKKAVAFDSKKDRDQYLEKTKLTNAKALTRKEAEKLAYWELDEKIIDIASGGYLVIKSKTY